MTGYRNHAEGKRKLKRCKGESAKRSGDIRSTRRKKMRKYG
jgi:hypothetical protein